MATSAANGGAADANGSTSQLNPSTHGSSKQSFAARMSDSTRKAEEDGYQRRTAQPKAWTSGVNPITQRANTSSQVNGNNMRPSNEKAPLDRQAWVYGNAIGLECVVATKTGQSFSGIFVGLQKSSDDQKVVLKMVKNLTPDAKELDGAVPSVTGPFCGHGPEHKLVFPASLVHSIEVPQATVAVKSQAANGGFRTDTDISGNQSIRERSLQRWEASPAEKNIDLSLESTLGGWDQFKANEQQFGLKSDYDENLYTTQIDRSNPLFEMRAREAERIAREIEGSSSTNLHIREERGIVDDGGDEEERYSGVRRDFASLQSNQPNRYIPPSRRNQTAAEAAPSTLPGKDDSVDPAIISSQIARPHGSEVPQPEPPIATASLSQAPSTTSVGPTAPSSGSVKDVKSPRQLAKPSGSALANNIEQKVLDSFQQFSANEKIKIQDQKRTRASNDKMVRINELMKFSLNFKLLTPVPKDLVPILAKDEGKQKEIVQKAQQNAESTQSSRIATLVEPQQKTARSLAPARWETDSASTSTVPGDRARQTSASQAVQASDRKQQHQIVPSSLSAKLSDHHRAHKAVNQGSVPTALSSQDPRRESRGSAQQSALPSPQKPASIRGSSSTAGAKLNVKAMEFKPTAAPFKPSSAATTAVASSPRSGPTTRTLSPAGVPPKFFPDKLVFAKPEDRHTPATVVKQKRAETGMEVSGADSTIKASAPPIPPNQGGFQFPYRTAPTWTVVDEPDHEPDYKTVFNERRPRRMHNHPQHTSPGASVPHHFPMHMPTGAHGMPHMQPQPPGSQQLHQQGHYTHPPPFDDHHMRPSASAASFPTQSPRMQQPNMLYQSPMPAHAQMAYPQQMQFPMQTPPMGGRQFSNGPPMGPMQGGHLAPMMVPHHSSSGFMPPQMIPYSGQMPLYASPGPSPAIYGSPGQTGGGFPSPNRAAPMMVQNSQQGQPPIFVPTNQYGQPMYAQQPANPMIMRPMYGSPQPSFAQHSFSQHQYPPQVHRTPSQGYAQPQHTPQQQHAAPQQPGPPAQPSDVGEEVK